MLHPWLFPPKRMLGAEETSSYLFEKLGLDIAECFDEFGRVKMNLISADTFLRGDKWEKDEAYRFRTFETYQSLRYYAWLSAHVQGAANNTHEMVRGDADAEWMHLIGFAALKNDMDFNEVYEAFVKAWQWEYAPYFVGAAEVVYPSGAVYVLGDCPPFIGA